MTAGQGGCGVAELREEEKTTTVIRGTRWLGCGVAEQREACHRQKIGGSRPAIAG